MKVNTLPDGTRQITIEAPQLKVIASKTGHNLKTAVKAAGRGLNPANWRRADTADKTSPPNYRFLEKMSLEEVRALYEYLGGIFSQLDIAAPDLIPLHSAYSSAAEFKQGSDT